MATWCVWLHFLALHSHYLFIKTHLTRRRRGILQYQQLCPRRILRRCLPSGLLSVYSWVLLQRLDRNVWALMLSNNDFHKRLYIHHFKHRAESTSARKFNVAVTKTIFSCCWTVERAIITWGFRNGIGAWNVYSSAVCHSIIIELFLCLLWLSLPPNDVVAEQFSPEGNHRRQRMGL